MHFDSLIQKSTNKVKTTCNIVKTLTNNKTNSNKTKTRDFNFNINQITANIFNQYFSSIAGNLIKKTLMKSCANYTDPLTYLSQNFEQPNAAIRLKNTTTHEV